MVILVALGFGVFLCWIIRNALLNSDYFDRKFEAKCTADTYGYKFTRYYPTSSLFLCPTGEEIYKSRDARMDRIWNGTLCRVYRLPLTKEGYEQCKAEEWVQQ